MTRSNVGRLCFRAGGSVLLAFALTLPVTASATGVSGDAYGVYVRALGVTQDQTPRVVLDPVEGLVTDELASLAVGNLLTAKSLDVGSSGVVGENAASSQSRSTTQEVNILGGVIKAQTVVAMANSASNGATAASNSDGSSLVGLVVNGTPITGSVAPNTRIDLPGIGTVTLNEQSLSGDGVTSSGLKVNMIHVLLKDSLTGLITTGEIIVGSATSVADFSR